MAAVAITFGASMITAILKPMTEKAGMETLDFLDKMFNIKTEIVNLQNTVHIIAGVIQVAEEKQIENHHIRAWLRQLVDIGYEARDVLDVFFTYCSLKRSGKASKSVKSKFLSSFFRSGSSSSTVSNKTRYLLASAITNVREKLDELKRQNDLYLNLKSVVSPSDAVPVCQRPETGPCQDKQRDVFVGRDVVKEDIMLKVLNHTSNHVYIIPILGMGGIGKTTLAQSIINDPRVTEGDMYPSKNRVWHCLGEKKLKAKEITMTFVDGVNSTSSIANIQRRLVEKFKGDKFLIVLDDVWDVDRNEWKLLFQPLTNVGKGGVVILTTRIRKVVDATNAQIQDCLQPLSDEECWTIFKSHAFADGNSNSRQDLVFIGKQIVMKLRGLPLAAEMVGCSLKNEPDAKTWRSFLETKEWLLKDGNDDIMSALKWSYSRLPPHLKQCFMYCSLFPKDHRFDEEELTKMWMAHDIVPNVGRGGESRRPEDVGAQYFKELVNASLFQCINGKYVMHDMIHDLAILVSNEDFITLRGEQSLAPQLDNVRHVRIINPEDYAKNPCLCKSKRILTVYYLNYAKICDAAFPHLGNVDYVLKQWKSIRVLVLNDYGITEIPDCINELKHLRYLDVSKTKVTSLPDSLFELYNLQTLYLPNEVYLPKKVGNLKNLRHLSGALFTSCKVIAQLTSLQDISGIMVCEGDCISELRHLRGLRGTLAIYDLGNVTSSEDAAQAKMQDKVFIDDLQLHFMEDEEDTVSTEECGISRDVLEALNCPPNLKHLAIYYYNGDRFPSWLTNASNSMRFLCILKIHSCEVVELLQLDGFVSLRRLHVKYCSNLQRIRLAKEVAATIEDLSIESCPELREMEIESLPSLRILSIVDCDKHISFSRSLVIQDLGNPFTSWFTNAANSMRFLCVLKIEDCGVVELLQLDAFVSLKQLDVRFCSNLQRIRLAKEVAATIEHLSIEGCRELMEMEIESLPSLRELWIRYCDKLISFPPCLVKIQTLEVMNCNLRSLSFTLHGIESLRYLDFYNCPMLKRFFIVEEGTTSSSSSSSSSSSITTVLSLPDNDEDFISLSTHKFEHDAEGRLVLNSR